MTAGLSLLIARFADRIGMIDHPGGIKSHASPIPYGGGIAIILGTFLSVWLVYPEASSFYKIIFAASFVVFLGGLWDDVRPLGAPAKFSIQFAASTALIAFDLHLKIAAFPYWLNIALTYIWMLGITNAINLIDILDGLAGGVVGIAAFAFGAIGFIFNDPELVFLCWILSGSLFGFLLFNLPPARIFMGDAGAQFLGFLLAAISIEGAYTTFNRVALFAPVLILGLPICDTSLVVFHRMRRGLSPFAGSADHIALRMKSGGLSTPNAVRVCYFATGLLSITAVTATLVPFEFAIVVYLLTFLAVLLFAYWLSLIAVE